MPRWTAEEIILIKKHYNTMPMRDLQVQFFPNRTLKAVEMKAAKLGITRPHNRDNWTQEEKELLIQNINMTPAELQANFFPNKTYNAISSAKNRIINPGTNQTGQKTTRKKWTKTELKTLKKYYGTMPAHDLQKTHLPGRTVRSISQTAYILQEHKRAKPYWTDDERDIIKKYYGKIPTTEIQKQFLPNRSRQSIENQIKHMQLPRAYYPKNQKDQE